MFTTFGFVWISIFVFEIPTEVLDICLLKFGILFGNPTNVSFYFRILFSFLIHIIIFLISI
jgi:hypothetical protein